jgi:hypothetical protein
VRAGQDRQLVHAGRVAGAIIVPVAGIVPGGDRRGIRPVHTLQLPGFRAAADERRVHEPHAGLEPGVHVSNVVYQADGFPEQIDLGRGRG